MKNILVPIVIILIAAGLISAGWYAFATVSSEQSLVQDGSAEFAPDGEQLSEEGQREHPPGAEGEGASNSVSQLFSGMAVIVGQTALVIALVALMRMLINKFGPMVFNKTKANSYTG